MALFQSRVSRLLQWPSVLNEYTTLSPPENNTRDLIDDTRLHAVLHRLLPNITDTETVQVSGPAAHLTAPSPHLNPSCSCMKHPLTFVSGATWTTPQGPGPQCGVIIALRLACVGFRAGVPRDIVCIFTFKSASGMLLGPLTGSMYNAPMGVAETTAAMSRRKMVAARIALPVRLAAMIWCNAVV